MKRLIKRLIKEEAKQVGTLYHFTELKNLIDILNQDTLKGKATDYVSFTRNKYFLKYSRDLSNGHIDCILVINGDNLSNNYKIESFHDQKFFNEDDFGTEKMESEERIKSPISPIKLYITNITLLKNEITEQNLDDIIENGVQETINGVKQYIENTYGINVNIE